jgi:hypothetical protein
MKTIILTHKEGAELLAEHERRAALGDIRANDPHKLLDPRHYQAVIKTAANAMRWMLDFVREDDPEITAAQLWEIALGYAYQKVSGNDPHNSGWLDWLNNGWALLDYTIGTGRPPTLTNR